MIIIVNNINIIIIDDAGSPARLQGELAVSRAFGDPHYRNYGLVADPEMHWHNISAADRWLILVSDGVLETMSEGDICQMAMSTEHGMFLLRRLVTTVGLCMFRMYFCCNSAAGCCGTCIINTLLPITIHTLLSSYILSRPPHNCRLSIFSMLTTYNSNVTSYVACYMVITEVHLRPWTGTTLSWCVYSNGTDTHENSVCAGWTLSLSPPAAIPLGPTHGDWGAPHPLSASEVPEQHGCSCSVGKASDIACMEGSAHQDCQDQQQHGPPTLQQAISDKVQTAAYDSGSSDNLAVVVLDLSRQPTADAEANPHLCCKAAGMSEANCAVSLPQCIALEDESKGTASADDSFPSNQRRSTNQEPNKIFGRALSAELASGSAFEFGQPPEWSGVTLWHDGSQVSLGSSVGRSDKPTSQYKLLQQMAELPRYADHVHTSWAGLPVLSTTSLWLQPHLPRFATSHCPTSPHPHAEEGICTDVLWGLDEGLEASLHKGSSQVMLSPGTMLQLVPRTDAIPASCSWDAWDSSPCYLGPADNCPGPVCDALHTRDNADWLTTTAVALAEVALDMYFELSTHGPALPDDALDQHPEDVIPGSDSITVQRVPVSQWQHGTVHEWQKYHRGRSFARGSFGEVWHAEKASAGE